MSPVLEKGDYRMSQIREIREKSRKKAEELVSKMTVKELTGSLLYDAPAIRRLNIPAYNWWNEGLHGAARSGTATVFPQAIGLAAMFDVPFMKEIGTIVSTEQRAKYNAYSSHGDRGIYKGLTVWSPNINIFRDPRWGRGQETYGEDPYLTSECGTAFVMGLQGNGSVLRTAATIKHFAAHSGPEPERHHFNAVVGKKDLEETYFPAFRRIIRDAEVDGVMGAYSCLNGEPCCATSLMEDLIRKEWGFDGIFISDCWALRDIHEQHHVTSSPEESAALALKSGCSINCGCTYNYLEKALSKGLITKEDIRKAAVRAYTTLFELGLFDGGCEYDNIDLSVIESEKHRNASLKASLNSLVLLENRDGFLPLKSTDIKVAVIGPNSDSRIALWGNYHGTSSRYVTVLEGIRHYVKEGNVFYSEGSLIEKDNVERLAARNDRAEEAVAMAEISDVVVLCLGLDEKVEGEMHDDGNGGVAGDKDSLRLPPCQRLLLDKLDRVGKPIILILMSGGALNPEIDDKKNVKALVQAWYPGEYGGEAIARTIFGLSNPSGKLPVTFYRSIDNLPDYSNYSMKGRTYRYFTGEVLYPFGHGLSYTTYEYSNAEYEDGYVSVDVENTGNVPGDEISFVFAHTDSPDSPPNSSLIGFTRSHLETGEKKRLRINLSSESFTLVDDDGLRYEKKGQWNLTVGGRQNSDISLEIVRR